MPRRSYPVVPILLLFFGVFVLLELWILILLAKATSLGFTLLVVIGSAIFGAGLAKHEGMAALRRVQTDMAQGRLPARSLADGVVVLLGAALLIVPGLITDFIGLTTLLPFCRRFYANLLMNWAKRNLRVQGGGAAPGAFSMFTRMGAPPESTSGSTPSGAPSPDETPRVHIFDPDREKRVDDWREQMREGDDESHDVIDADFEDESKGSEP